MDAHKVLKEAFYQFGISDITQYSNYIYAGIAIICLLSYFFSKQTSEHSLINFVALKRKVKDLEALTAQLSVSLEKLEENYENSNRQTTFRLDMQSAEQKEIRIIVTKLNGSIEHLIQNFYESD